MADGWKGPLERVDEFRWRIPVTYKAGMRVPGMIYADERHVDHIREDQAPEQVANAAFLPGMVGMSLAMPDIHWGYGFAIGGVGATLADEGAISPGGVGFDINCGVRLLRTNLFEDEVRACLEPLVNQLFRDIPSGVGSTGVIKLGKNDTAEVLEKGALWAVENGYGWPRDLDHTEERGAMKGADAGKVSDKAIKRGMPQLGTLGSGNHFLEVQVVDQVFDSALAERFGLSVGQVVVMIHSGSRGLGHQVCTDYLARMEQAIKKYGITIPDRQLACAPLSSPEGRDYFAAMACAANYAWANRQCIMHWTREAFAKVFRRSPEDLGMELIYDVAHNIAKIEDHVVDGKRRRVCVHRKGATRAFPAGHPDVPADYRETGQPVLVPGDMGRNSYLLVGTQRAMEETFGSTCHGAGRVMSRAAAKKAVSGAALQAELRERGIIVKAASRGALAEETPEAYKDVNEVVHVCHGAGISHKVARMKPLGVVKG
ncbi:MAG TPA: RtcB family protein [Firmicutes bacterium]|nr:RtcB family protein [Bacillota bacterium]